ncbi:MAG TPA: DUF4383 domain-containing protein [Thermoleophilaceae bacterium]
MREELPKSSAQRYARVAGWLLVALGIAGFFYNSSFATGHETLTNRDAVFGAFDVNGWHNLLHLLAGLIGVRVARSYAGSRAYAYAAGLFFLLLALLGALYGDGDSIFKLFPVNTGDDVLHLVLGLAGLLAATLTSPTPAPSHVARTG